MQSLRVISRSALRKAKTKALLITNLTNIHALTGVKASAGLLLLRPSSAILFLDKRYAEAASRILPRSIALRDPEDFPAVMKTLSRVAFEAEDVTVARLARWQKQWKRVTFIPTDGIVEEYRRSKSPRERACILRACRIARRLLRGVPGMLRAGISERDLACSLETLARSLGAEGMAFDTIVAFGEHSSRPHHRPSSRRLRRGDVVQIDLGVTVQGYCSDYSRVFVFGAKTAEHRRVEKALKEAKNAAQHLVRPGVDVRALDRAARAVLRTYGYDEFFTHSLGHGLGLEIHERPTISSKTKRTTLRSHEAITIEPGIYFPGKWGMRIEDTIIVS